MQGLHQHQVENINEIRHKDSFDGCVAPDDFGGNKAAAIRDTEQAIHSLKKALYFRLKMDDAALDRAQ
jgi:hypothetical protein